MPLLSSHDRSLDSNPCLSLFQGLQRRATPHPSELKVMKKVIEERRNEAYTSRSDGEEESLDQQVLASYCVMITWP